MTNRDRYILKRNEYDMLNAMQSVLIKGKCVCVIEALSGSVYPCRCSCAECIQKWLNSEE